MFNKLIKYFRKHGFIEASDNLSKYIFRKYIYPKYRGLIDTFTLDHLVYLRRIRLSNALAQQLSNTIQYGPFRGLKLKARKDWNGNMFLGLYEKEVLDILQTIPEKYTNLINLGAADGYYAIGSLVAKLFKKTYCYEISTSSQKNIIENAKLNKVIS